MRGSISRAVSAVRWAVACLFTMGAIAQDAPESRAAEGSTSEDGPVVLMIRIKEEGDPSAGFASAEFDRRRHERTFVFEVRPKGGAAGVARYEARCIRVFGLLTHPINVRSAYDSDDPPDPKLDTLESMRRLKFVAPHGASLTAEVGPGGAVRIVDGLDRVEAELERVRKRAGYPKSPMTSGLANEAELTAIIEPLFAALPSEEEMAKGSSWTTAARFGVVDMFESEPSEIVESRTGFRDGAHFVEGASVATKADGTPMVFRRSKISAIDGLPIASHWTIRREAGMRSVSVAGEVKRVSTELVGDWLAAVRSADPLDDVLTEIKASRGRRLMSSGALADLFWADGDAAARAMAALASLGVDAADAVEALTTFAANEEAPEERRRQAVWVVRDVLFDVRRAAALEAFDSGDGPATSRPAANRAAAFRKSLLPRLVELWTADDGGVRAAAAYVSGEFGADVRPHFPKLLERLKVETDGYASSGYAFAAGAAGVDDPAFAAPLAKVLAIRGDPYGYAARNAGWALSVLGQGALEALPALVEALETAPDDALPNVFEALRGLGAKAKSASEALRAITKRPGASPWIRETAADVLKAVES